MILQFSVLIFLYIMGVLWAALFYPKISPNLIASSGLFWGGLINTILGILLGLMHLYSEIILFVLCLFTILLVIIHIRTRKRWVKVSLSSLLTPIAFMFTLFIIALLIIGNEFRLITTSASLPYIIYGSHVNHYGTIFFPGAGYDFRSNYGISEVMIHALSGFINLPAISLWHPFLWISQYAFLFAAILEFSKENAVNKNIAMIIGSLTLLWTATSPMNWMQSYYIHVHLFSSFSILISVFFLWRIANSTKEEAEYAIFSSFALCGFGFSRVESPIFIFILLLITFFNQKFFTKEYCSFFYPPIILQIGWLIYLFFAYQGTDTQYWTDSRLLITIGTYFLFLIFLMVNKSFELKINKQWINKYISLVIIAVPFMLFAFDPSKSHHNLQIVLNNMFGTLQKPGFGPWGFYWFEAVLLLFILLKWNPWKTDTQIKRNFGIIIIILISYFVLILVLGFFREDPYSRIRWGDSATRMLTHISPTFGLLIGICYLDLFSNLKKSGSKLKGENYHNLRYE